MPTSNVVDLAELLSIEAEAALEAWEEALRLEQVGIPLDPIHFTMTAALLLDLVPMRVRELCQILLAEPPDQAGRTFLMEIEMRNSTIYTSPGDCPTTLRFAPDHPIPPSRPGK
jgi:hypothetical protein